MNRKSVFALAVSLALCMPALAQDGSVSGGQEPTTPPLRGEHEAMRMVPARAALKSDISADKVTPGATFEARLAHKIQLTNGPLLPAGTRLVGTVVTDEANSGGPSTLALRFDTAYLKDGMTVPIKATIVGLYGPEDFDNSGSAVAPGDQAPNTWNDGTLRIDSIGVIKGVDLHSAIANPNSGVFVSENNRNVKIAAGSELALAIAARTDTGDANTVAGER
jgi:hypothetical protein